MTKFEVGQELWYVPRYSRGNGRTVTIAKVGRKWLTFDANTRVERESLCGEHGARAYLSREAHEYEQRLRERWLQLKRAIGDKWSPPVGLTLEAIDQAFDALSLERPET